MGILTDLSLAMLIAASSVALFAGFVKGAVGFGMPLIMVSGLATVFSVELALAALILPTAFTNLQQSLRNGFAAAWKTVKKYRWFLAIMIVVLALSAQLVTRIPQGTLFIIIGTSIVVFSVMQLSGWKPVLRREHKARTEAVVAIIAGFIGGLSGVWGPPIVAYLTALETPKAEQMRVQGVLYGLGAVGLIVAHVKSGVFNASTAPLSAFLLLPALLGMFVGGQLHDRMPQATFKKATLIILVVAGLNLIRKGVVG